MNTFKLKRFKAKTNNVKAHSRTPRHYKTMRIGLVLATMMFGGVFYGLAVSRTPETEAIEPADFNAGYLIDDSVFYNPNTMTVEEIQKFLEEKSPTCDMWGTGLISGRQYPDGTWVPAGTTRAQYAQTMRTKYGKSRYHDPPYVCINKYYENPETKQSLYDTQGVATAGMKSAAQIIYDVAQEYSINPQVLLVMIKKESSVWGDNWPLSDQYNTVMGYGCPDTAPCNEAYFGFYNQIQKAAWQFKYYREHPTSYGYRPNATNNILYHPNISCGTKQVYLENIATTSLYIYTPYTPNDAALRAYPAAGDACSSYGNRNFYMFFREWFGSTHKEIKNESLTDGDYIFISKLAEDRQLSSNDLSAILSNKQHVWRVTKTTAGYYLIIDNDSGYYLSLSNTAAGQLVLRERLEDLSQEWIFAKNSDSTYTLYSAKNYGVIDVSNASTNIGTAVQIYESNNTHAQKWTLSPHEISSTPPVQDSETLTSEILEEDIYYVSLQSNKSNLMSSYLGALQKQADGENVLISSPSEEYSQKWKISYIQNSKAYSIIDATTGMSLDVAWAGKRVGTNIQVYTSNNTPAQLWEIKKTTHGNYIIVSKCSNLPIGVKNGNIELLDNSELNKMPKWSISKAPSSETSIEDNLPLHGEVFYIASAINKNAVIDIHLAKRSNGANIQIYSRNNTAAQKWTLQKNSDDTYSFINPNSKKAIDVSNGNLSNRANIWLYESNSSCAQKWKLLPQSDGSYIIANACKEKMVIDLDDSKTTNGTNIQLFSRWGEDNLAQRWFFVPL